MGENLPPELPAASHESGLASARALRVQRFEDVAQELRRRIDEANPRHVRWYGAVRIDKKDPNLLTTLHALSQQICTREITHIFTRGFVASFRCATYACPREAVERCHGVDCPRPKLFARAWQDIEGRHEQQVPLAELMKQFLELHLEPEMGFSLRCHPCHRDENKPYGRAYAGLERCRRSEAASARGAPAPETPPRSEAEDPIAGALRSFERFHNRPCGSASVAEVAMSSAGLGGWAAHAPPGDALIVGRRENRRREAPSTSCALGSIGGA